MTYDLTNTIQRGLDYNTATEDAYASVNNAYVLLGDSYGGTEFSTVDAYGIKKLIAKSDGYLGVLGNVFVNGFNATNNPYISLADNTATSSAFLLNANPNGVVSGTKGSIGLDYSDGYLYSNFGGTSWARYATLNDLGTAGTHTETLLLPLAGAILNGNALQNNYSETASIDMPALKDSKMLYQIPVPSDWDGISNFNVVVLWTPQSINTGNVRWQLEYKVLNLTNLITTAVTIVTYSQASSGTTSALASTGTNLSIPGGSVSASNAMININILRNGSDVSDTFTSTASITMIQIQYTAKNVV